MIASLAFGGVALLTHVRTDKVGAKWGALIFAFVGGVLMLTNGAGETARGALADLHPLVPQIMAAIAVGVLLVDVLADLKPDAPAAVAAFVLPTLFIDVKDIAQGSGLATAVGCGLVAAFIQAKVGEAASAGKASGKTGRRKALCWSAAGLALVGGIAWAATSYNDTVNGWLVDVHADIPGSIGLIAAAAIVIDLFDRRPDQYATVGAYLLPPFFFPMCSLVSHYAGEVF